MTTDSPRSSTGASRDRGYWGVTRRYSRRPARTGSCATGDSIHDRNDPAPPISGSHGAYGSGQSGACGVGHAIAIQMAAPVLTSGSHEDLYKLANQIVTSQGQEIAEMETWLNQWYGVPVPTG